MDIILHQNHALKDPNTKRLKVIVLTHMHFVVKVKLFKTEWTSTIDLNLSAWIVWNNGTSTHSLDHKWHKSKSDANIFCSHLAAWKLTCSYKQ